MCAAWVEVVVMRSDRCMRQVMGKACMKRWARVACSSGMAGIRAKHCGGGQVGGVRVESGWGRKRGTHRWRNSCLLAIPSGVDLEANALNKVMVIVGAGTMSSPLTRSRGRLHWRDRSNPSVLGSIEVGEAEHYR